MTDDSTSSDDPTGRADVDRDGPAAEPDEEMVALGVPAVGFLQSSLWWGYVARSLGLALVGAVSALLFVGGTEKLTELIWDEPPSGEAFSGSVRVLVVLTAAGVLVGLVRRLVPSADEVNVFDGLVAGRVEPHAVPGGLLVATCSIVGGASLGPEVPTGMLAGGLATAVAERQGWDEEGRRAAVTASVSSAWGGLFTSPYVSTLMTLELAHVQSPAFWPFLLIDVAAALVGFVVFYAAGGWADLLRFLDLPAYSFAAVDLAWAVLIGVICAVAGVGFVALVRGFHALAAMLGPRPLLKGTVAGLGLGVLAMALPLTLFNGANGLVQITERTAEIGVGVIVLSAVCKLAATAAALGLGFIGGPIFPAMFAGGAIGVAVADVFPDAPVALVVAAGIAALPAGLVSVPMSTAVLSLLVVGASVEAAPGVLTAALVAFGLVRGVGELHLPVRLRPRIRRI